LPLGPHGRGGRAARRRGAGVARQPRLSGAASAPGARRGLGPSRRAARGLGSRARSEVAPGARRGGRGPGHVARLRAHWLAQDVRFARDARPRADRTALDLRRSAPRGAGAGARRGAPRARAGDEQVVEGRAPRRVRGLQPERQRPDRGLRLLGTAHAPKYPLIEIARAKRKQDALAGLKRWKARHPKAAKYLEPADVLVDSMRGRSSTWTRIRVNLQHVPPKLRPRQERLDPDEKTLASW